jgi:hypothetical protein
MQGVQRTADQAVSLARAFLRWREPGSRIHDVQHDPRFQHRGVDLLWEVGDRVQGVEVKGDRNRANGNYFLELVSNVERDTPGCFLYSEADWLLYAFVRAGELHALPLRAAREWFLPRAKEFELRHTRTRLGAQHYTTVGALVPVRRLLGEVPGAERILDRQLPTLAAL